MIVQVRESRKGVSSEGDRPSGLVGMRGTQLQVTFVQVACLVATQRHSGKVGSKAGQTSKRATTVVSYGKKVYFDFFFSWIERGKLRSRNMKSAQLYVTIVT